MLELVDKTDFDKTNLAQVTNKVLSAQEEIPGVEVG